MSKPESSEWLLGDESVDTKPTYSKVEGRALSNFIIGASLIILTVLNITQYWRSITAPNPSQIVYSPVQHLLSYELREFGTGKPGDPSPYFGEPSTKLDRAWRDLYPSVYQLIPKESAAQLVEKTLIFPHDPQRRYVVELEVFHLIHCLNMIRKSTRPDYYKGFAPGIVNSHTEDLLFGPEHVSHCIESIRQAIMCHVDVTPYTWIWNSTSGHMQNVFATPHTCRNFDAIRDWARPENNGGNVSAGFDGLYREMNDPLDKSTWINGYRGD
ncbi:hypothetical protein HYALB_00007224 [Hymenoscyphus albidus]|uniref:Cyclochlorotine biosynthesis protein O n=1 Tax=Hymenoscyphus albidus TaxID=595503 RepID=A0A9N9Q1J4_9HELO|nr:hypothetical protein HYALB_00007224 [Hymenoscyphus albidus]